MSTSPAPAYATPVERRAFAQGATLAKATLDSATPDEHALSTLASSLPWEEAIAALEGWKHTVDPQDPDRQHPAVLNAELRLLYRWLPPPVSLNAQQATGLSRTSVHELVKRHLTDRFVAVFQPTPEPFVVWRKSWSAPRKWGVNTWSP